MLMTFDAGKCFSVRYILENWGEEHTEGDVVIAWGSKVSKFRKGKFNLELE